ncbi:MAG TPA: hypothetical protein VER14_09195 [Phototrophicaceae bacterium]|nr:hypothetical protein [Phototrophicaceae bacterium]
MIFVAVLSPPPNKAGETKVVLQGTAIQNDLMFGNDDNHRLFRLEELKIIGRLEMRSHRRY